jgi:hypothetical protein
MTSSHLPNGEVEAWASDRFYSLTSSARLPYLRDICEQQHLELKDGVISLCLGTSRRIYRHR